MSDETTPQNDQPEGTGNPDSTPTEALQLADQQPVAADEPTVASPPVGSAAVPASASATSHPNHTRTILEVVGGVVAAGMIVVAGAVGFAVGHATGGDGDDWRMDRSAQQWGEGPEAGGPVGPGQGGRQGGGREGEQDGQQGFGGGQGARPGHQDGQQGLGGGREGRHSEGGQGFGQGQGPGQGFGQGQGQGRGYGEQDGTGPLTESEPTPSSTS